MGFGIIFLGYATLLFFKTIPVGLIGAYLMYKGLSKLSVYGEKFCKARNVSAVFFVYFAVYTVLWIANVLQTEIVAIADSLVYYGIFCVFQIVLCNALESISGQVGYDKGIRKARVCKTATYVFIAASIVRIVLSFFSLAGYMTVAMMFYELLLLFITASFIYSCYMMIATQDIIDEENKKMREYDEKYSMLKKKEKSAFSVKRKR